MTTAHIHAHLMAEYAKDALETETPWERWERQTRGSNTWTNCTCSPNWTSSTQYRRKRVPLCQVKGKDVFAGDRLWHEGQRKWLVAERCSGIPNSIYCEESYPVLIRYLSWSEPPKTKTVYQWAYFRGTWQITIQFYETEEQALNGCIRGENFRRLDYTALEVPCDD